MPDIQTIGTLDGVDVQAITLRSPSGLTARVITFGARLAELWVPDRQGAMADIVLGHDQLEDWVASTTFFGATCGRYANRIAGGRFVLDGKPVQLDRNEGEKHLHGGRAGFDRRIWRVIEAGEGHVTLGLTSADGDMGYPGTMEVRCRYGFDASDRLWIEMTATTDAPTVINLVNHCYFNMAGQGSGDVLGQHLHLTASHYTPVDADLIPTGEVRAVAGTDFDFTAARAIGDSLPGETGFDHNLCLTGPTQLVAGESLRHCAIATDPASGRRMEVWTTEPGVQLYTGGYLDGRLPGKAGAAIGRFGGFTLETQRFPDSPNQPQFPSARLDPGQTYRHLMAFSFAPAAG